MKAASSVSKCVSLLKTAVFTLLLCAACNVANAEYYVADDASAYPCPSCYRPSCHSGCGHVHRHYHHRYYRHSCHRPYHSSCYHHWVRRSGSYATVEVYYVWPTAPTCGGCCGCGDVWVRSTCGPCESSRVMYVPPDYHYYSYPEDNYDSASYGPDWDMRTADDEFADPGLND